MKKSLPLSKTEKRKYVMSTDRDFEILAKIHQIEKNKRISKKEKDLLRFIKTQLELDWRTPILKTLNKILEKYEKG